jgi:hypothetical protein
LVKCSTIFEASVMVSEWWQIEIVFSHDDVSEDINNPNAELKVDVPQRHLFKYKCTLPHAELKLEMSHEDIFLRLCFLDF